MRKNQAFLQGYQPLQKHRLCWMGNALTQQPKRSSLQQGEQIGLLKNTGPDYMDAALSSVNCFLLCFLPFAL